MPLEVNVIVFELVIPFRCSAGIACSKSWSSLSGQTIVSQMDMNQIIWEDNSLE